VQQVSSAAQELANITAELQNTMVKFRGGFNIKLILQQQALGGGDKLLWN